MSSIVWFQTKLMRETQKRVSQKNYRGPGIPIGSDKFIFEPVFEDLRTIFCGSNVIIVFGFLADVDAKWSGNYYSGSSNLLKNWPTSNDQCRFRLGEPGNYSRENTVIRCPRWTGDDEPRTYFRVIELLEDIVGERFTKNLCLKPLIQFLERLVEVFQNPQFKSGRSWLHNDSEVTRRVEFSVKGSECQYVNYLPDWGIPLWIVLIICSWNCNLPDFGANNQRAHRDETGKVTATFRGEVVRMGPQWFAQAFLYEQASSRSMHWRSIAGLTRLDRMEYSLERWSNTSGIGNRKTSAAIGVVPTTIKAKPPKEAEKSPWIP